jgi:putative nucleotidyltransferase with HDIG domain
MTEDTEKAAATILVVEDDAAMLIALRDILEGEGYRVCTADNGRAAIDVFLAERPSLILSDISMPVMDGIGFYDSVRKLPGGTTTPFVFLTARGTREDIFAGKSIGADDYITKPITSQELISAVRARLARADEMRLAQLRTAYKDSLKALANGIEARDHYTRDHVDRVSAYAQAMARELGWSDQRLEMVEFGAILHDIGKIAVREAILTKPGPLTPEEWAEMRQHTEVGAKMVQAIPYLAPALPIVLHHHERWDGSGYPNGLAGEDIPEEARLLAVVDAFDAMTSDRPYHPAHSPEGALEEIISLAGKQFDPRMVTAFTTCWDRGELAPYL